MGEGPVLHSRIVLTVRELKELTQALTDGAFAKQLGPFVLVQRPFIREPQEIRRASTLRIAKSKASAVDFGDLWVVTLPPLRESDSFVVGRNADCDLVIDEKTVSSRHARIDWTKGLATLTDLGSSNGTEINGAALKPELAQPVSDNDAIDFGGVRVLFLEQATFRKRMGISRPGR